MVNAKTVANTVKIGNSLTVIKEAIDYFKTRETEQTKREEIRAKRDVLISALDNEKEVLLTYFEHRFTERKTSLEQFYGMLQESVSSKHGGKGDMVIMQAALAGILGVIKENPLSDFAEFQKNMAKPDYKLEL